MGISSFSISSLISSKRPSPSSVPQDQAEPQRCHQTQASSLPNRPRTQPILSNPTSWKLDPSTRTNDSCNLWVINRPSTEHGNCLRASLRASLPSTSSVAFESPSRLELVQVVQQHTGLAM